MKFQVFVQIHSLIKNLLNKNLIELNETFSIFEYDEEKLIIELQKKDFIIEKENQKKDKNNITTKKFKFKKSNKKLNKK